MAIQLFIICILHNWFSYFALVVVVLDNQVFSVILCHYLHMHVAFSVNIHKFIQSRILIVVRWDHRVITSANV